MPSLKITQFSGVIPRKQSQNLQKITAQVAEDVDLSRETLRPWRTDKKISSKTGNALFVDGCCVLTSDNCKASYSVVDTDCKYIIASGIADYPVINRKPLACNDEWVRLGLPLNLQAPKVKADRIIPPGPTDYDRNPSDFNLEVRQYYYTLVDIFGFESAPSYPTEPQYFHNDKDVEIYDLPTSFPTYEIESVRLYCAVTQLDYGNMIEKGEVLKEDAHFLLVDEAPFGRRGIKHYAHNVYGEECLTEEYEPPADNIQDLQYCGNGQIGGLVGNELWLSEPLKPHAFPENYRYGRFNGKPKRFLCGEKIGYILTDEYPAVIEMETPCSSKGCRSVKILEEQLPLISYQSACLYNGSCFYASKDGLVMLNGTSSRIITKDLYTQDQWQALAPWTMIGVVHDGYYFGFTKTHSIRFKVPDDIHESLPSITTLSIKPTAVYRADQDSLFFTDENGTFQWNSGDEWKEFTWRGKFNVLGGYTAMTAYKLVQDYVPSHVIHTAYKRQRNEMVQDVVVLGDKIVNDSRPHRLKGGYSTINFDVEIKSKGEVLEYHVATSVSELGSQ